MSDLSCDGLERKMIDHMKLRELAAKATPIPWYFTADAMTGADKAMIRCGSPYAKPLAMSHESLGKAEVDFEYIVAACNALPALLDENEALLARAEAAEAKVARLNDLLDYLTRHAGDDTYSLNARIAELEAEIRDIGNYSADTELETAIFGIRKLLGEGDAALTNEPLLKSRVAELEAAARWIPMSSPPPDREEVLMYNPTSEYVSMVVMEDAAWILTRYSHWMPKPQPPEAE